MGKDSTLIIDGTVSVDLRFSEREVLKLRQKEGNKGLMDCGISLVLNQPSRVLGPH